MLRIVLGCRRKVVEQDGQSCLEDWLPWFKHATGEAEATRKEHHLPDWVEQLARRKFRWAGHVSRRNDGRWSKFLLHWSFSGCRRQGRPVIRWSDSINHFFEGLVGHAVRAVTWIAQAQDRDHWRQLEDEYVDFCRRGHRR